MATLTEALPEVGGGRGGGGGGVGPPTSGAGASFQSHSAPLSRSLRARLRPRALTTQVAGVPFPIREDSSTTLHMHAIAWLAGHRRRGSSGDDRWGRRNRSLPPCRGSCSQPPLCSGAAAVTMCDRMCRTRRVRAQFGSLQRGRCRRRARPRPSHSCMHCRCVQRVSTHATYSGVWPSRRPPPQSRCVASRCVVPCSCTKITVVLAI